MSDQLLLRCKESLLDCCPARQTALTSVMRQIRDQHAALIPGDRAGIATIYLALAARALAPLSIDYKAGAAHEPLPAGDPIAVGDEYGSMGMASIEVTALGTLATPSPTQPVSLTYRQSGALSARSDDAAGTETPNGSRHRSGVNRACSSP